MSMNINNNINTNPNTKNNNTGIDIRVALEILSLRSSETQQQINPDNDTHNTTISVGCPCCTNNNNQTIEDYKSWGQRIDITSNEQQKQQQQQHGETEQHKQQQDDDDDNQQQQKVKIIEEERTKRRIEIETKLQIMSIYELIHCLLQSQEQRVLTYRKYDKGLDDVLKTGNLTYYPFICAEATASFAVLSDTINCIQQIVIKRQSNQHQQEQQNQQLVQYIQTLQKYECEKLNLTAAYHLERIRLSSTSSTTTSFSSSSSSSSSTKEQELLQNGIISLQEKIRICITEINDIIEEIRYLLIDVIDK